MTRSRFALLACLAIAAAGCRSAPPIVPALTRVEPDDGVTDGDVEEFSIALAPSAVAVWIRARDVAGNEAVFSPRLVD